MKNGKTAILGMLALLVAAPALGWQQDEEAQLREEALREQAQNAEAEERLRMERSRDRSQMRLEEERMAAEMRQAEARLEEAARRIAELSSRQLPAMSRQSWALAFSGRPVLGITIEGNNQDGPVEGVEVRGVTPGGAAFEAGLRTGDIISAINGESLTADSSAAANGKLMDFMKGVQEGDTLDLDYLRDGKQASVELQPQAAGTRSFTFSNGMPGAPRPPRAPSVMIAPSPSVAPRIHEFMVWHNDGGWGDMEMVTLTSDLGSYFGTDEGLLVVRAPSGGDLQLKDGDVIQSIDGREPSSIAHAMRILASYQPGEQLQIEIMRDKRKRTLEVRIPDEQQSSTDGTVAPDVRVNVRREVLIN